MTYPHGPGPSLADVLARLAAVEARLSALEGARNSGSPAAGRQLLPLPCPDKWLDEEKNQRPINLGPKSPMARLNGALPWECSADDLWEIARLKAGSVSFYEKRSATARAAGNVADAEKDADRAKFSARDAALFAGWAKRAEARGTTPVEQRPAAYDVTGVDEIPF